MRVLLFLFVLLLIWKSPSAQEKYFHDLQGIEDSTGTTHLFYRLNDSNSVQCSYVDWDGTEYKNTYELHSNALYRLNTTTQEETLFFYEGVQMWSECSTTYPIIKFFMFSNHDYSTEYKVSTTDGYWFLPSLNYGRNSIYIGTIAGPFRFDYDRNKILIPIHFSDIIIKTRDYPEFGIYTLEADLFASDWDSINEFVIPFDSTFSDWVIVGINEVENNQYLAFKNDSILFSDNYGLSFELLLTDSTISTFGDDDFDYVHYNIPYEVVFRTQFDQYFFIDKHERRELPTNFSISRLYRTDSKWSIESLLSDVRISGFTFEESESSRLYLSDSVRVLISNDLGNTMSELISMNHEITGLYKKPDSNYLFVLTKEELIILNINTLEQQVIKILPVSNESEPGIPSSAQLHQNYPNPFNPTTNISYQLTADSFVQLKIFDALGREVAVLENGLKTAGNHSVTFDASNLSSGIYFYQLETDGQVLTRKLSLIK